MPTLVRTILPPTLVEWKWPLLTGLPPGSTFRPAALQQYHWARQLSRVSRISPSNRAARYNMVIFHGTAEAVNTFRRMAEGRFSIKTDVLLIKTGANFFSQPAPGLQLEQAAKMLARAAGAAGVIFFHTPLPDPEWYNDLLMEISHDLPVTQAIANIRQSQSWCFISPSLELATRLSTLISRLSDDLVKGKYIVTKPVQYIRPNTNVITTKSYADLGRFLKEDFNHLDYSGESKTGSQLLHINQNLKLKNVAVPGPVIIKPMTGVKRMFPMKGGGLEILTNWPATGGDTSAKPVIFPEKEKKSAKPPSHIGGIESASGRTPKKKGIKKNGGGHGPVRHASSKKGSSGGGGWNYAPAYDIPKKKAAKPPKKKAAAKKEDNAAEPLKPRFLQAIINQPGSDKSIADFLRPGTGYELNIFIGEIIKKAIRSDKAFADEEVFTDPNITEAEILLELITNLSDKKQYGKLTLPRNGNSDTASFLVQTPEKSGIFEAFITAYYKGRAIQSFRIRGDIRKPGGKPVWKQIVMKTEAAMLTNMENLPGRQPFGLSVTLPADAPAPQPVPAVANGKPLDLLFDSAFAQMAMDIKKVLETGIINNKATSLSDKENTDILYALASQGSIFYEQYFKEIKTSDPIQVISKRRDYIPLEFVYTFPAPGLNASICKKAKTALQKGKCEGCCKKDKDWETTFCPLGFWGLSRPVERHAYKEEQKNTTKLDYAVTAEPTTGRTLLKVLESTQFAESDKAGNGNPGLLKKVDDAIRGGSAKAAIKASDWSDWRTKVAKKIPESLVLIVHQEKDRRAGDCIEIGKDLLPITQFKNDYLKASGDNQAPFVVLIGCEVAKVEAAAFDAGNLLTGRGAAIVLSNFTKIRGKQAGEIVIKLVDLLKKLGKKETTFGEITLRLRQMLLAEGMIAGLTLLAYGDADWKIKT